MPNYAAGQGSSVCTQEYLEPYLLDGHKFDLRLYVVLAGVNPLKAYLCRVGMVRIPMLRMPKRRIPMLRKAMRSHTSRRHKAALGSRIHLIGSRIHIRRY